MKSQEIVPLILGIFLISAGIYILFNEPIWVSSVYASMAALIGAGVALILITLQKYRIRKSGEIKEDERDHRIAEKASFRTFQIIFIIQGVLYAILGILNIQLPAQPILGTLFAITGFSYMGFFYFYREKM